MKSTIALVCSVVALGVTVFVSFQSNTSEVIENVSKSSAEPVMAFIYSDSVNDKYQFVSDKTNQLETEAEKVQAEIERKISKLEKRFATLQKQAPTMTQVDMENAQMELAKMEQEVNEYRNAEGEKLDIKRIEMQKEFFKRVNDFLVEYNKKHSFQAIFSYTQGGQLLFVQDALDITDEVIAGLNKEYETAK